MRVLNWSYRVGCLQCYFTDKELNLYIQIKKRKNTLCKKNAVQIIGRQRDNTWVLGNNIYISCSGDEITASESDYVWISDVFSGPGVPSPSMSCTIDLPLSTEALGKLSVIIWLIISILLYFLWDQQHLYSIMKKLC